MKLFFRLILKNQPQGLEVLSQNVAIWNNKLREIFRSGNHQMACVPIPVIESLMACQDEDGLCRLLIDDETPPSEARVDFWYWPTYFLTASLIREQLLADQSGTSIPLAWQRALKNGLSAATGRELSGHGLEAEDVRVDVLNFYLDAGLWLFLAEHDSEHPAFSNLVTAILEYQRQAILSGKTQDGYTDNAKQWLNLQIRTGAINHLFTYGTLMTGQVTHARLACHADCQLEGKAFLTGYRLYDLGAYPAILPAATGDFPMGDQLLLDPEMPEQPRGPALVFGELHGIGNEQLAELDDYEGEGVLYDRVAAVVETIDGRREIAWIYVYKQTIDSTREVLLGLQPWNSEPAQQVANRYVWYVAYGSNLLRERFLCYIRGGWFRNIRSYDGCQDQRLPITDLPCRLPYAMYYGYESKTWQSGGVAFLDVRQKVNSQGRAWLITRDQFEDVHRQEVCSPNWYDRCLDLGRFAGIPVATFTNHGRRPENPPSQQYLAVVREGIKECKKRMQEVI